MVKIAILFHRLGAYHYARLDELSKISNLTVIEFSVRDNTYKWETVKPSVRYPVIQLFSDEDISFKSPRLVKKRLFAVLKHIDADILAIPGWSSPAALVALKWCLKNGIRAVLMADSTAHDEPRKTWKEWIKSRVVKLFSSGLVAGTPHVDYVSELGMPTERIFTGYDVVDNDYFSKHSDRVRQEACDFRTNYNLPTNFFLASNRFVSKKNISRLIDAYSIYLKHCNNIGWCLVLLGDGSLMPAIRKQVEQLGLNKNVIFPGFKQYDELPVYYGLAGAFVHASTSEQWGLVVNEAMASGLPVLVSARCGCAHDLVKSGINGFTFDPYDTEGLALLMSQISEGKYDLSAMQQQSKAIISEYSPKKFSENLVKAAEVAIASEGPIFKWYDRILLWALIHR